MKRLPLAVVGLSAALSACGDELGDDIFSAPEWRLEATVDEANRELVIEATFATVHDNDFVHMSIRKEGWDNAYPGRTEPDVDWTRPNLWFGDYYPNTYLEGGVYPGPGNYKRPPKEFTDYEYRLSLDETERTNWPDQRGSEFNYTTQLYNIYDNHRRSPGDNMGFHPGFGPGDYEIEIYAWYTGSPDDLHPAVGDEGKVQYIHYERRIVTTRFTID